LVVSRAERGTGLGRRLLDWACERARELGRASLRLDCVASNEFLRRYYADAGFEERGEVDLGRVRLARFERDLLSDSQASTSARSRSR
jgi:GNAT superfamily N-acetyltransferase